MTKFASPGAISLASILTLLKSWPGIWLSSAINPAELHQQSHNTVSTYPAQPQALLLQLVGGSSAMSCNDSRALLHTSHLLSRIPLFIGRMQMIKQPSTPSEALQKYLSKAQAASSLKPMDPLRSTTSQPLQASTQAPAPAKLTSVLFQRQPCLSWTKGNEEHQDSSYHSPSSAHTPVLPNAQLGSADTNTWRKQGDSLATEPLC